MPKSLRIVTGGNLTAPATYYFCGISGYAGNATEAPAQVACRPGGTFTNLWHKVLTNSLSATTTIRLRKNGANGNNVLSIGAGATGDFEDTTSSDTFADGDLISLYQSLTGTGNIVFGLVTIVFDPTDSTNTYSHVGSTNPQTFATASTTRYFILGGFNNGTPATVETSQQIKFHSSCTIKNLSIRVATNSRSASATTYRLRKNAGNGSGVISVSASATGRFEDTSNTDSIVANDLVCCSLTTGTGTQNFIWSYHAATIESTTNINYLPYGQSAGVNFASGGGTEVRYYNPGLLVHYSGENQAQIKLGAAAGDAILKNGTVTISYNDTPYDSYIYMRINSAYAYPAINILAGTTGIFSDTTDSDIIRSSTDLFNYIAYHTGMVSSFTTTAGMVELSFEPHPKFFSKVVNVASTSGTQDITFTPNGNDPNWTPKVAIVQWSYPNSSLNTFAEGVGRGYGFTDGTNQRCISMVSEDATTSSDTAASQYNNALIVGHNQTGTITTIDAQAAFSSWLTNGMRITWSNAPTAAFQIQVTFLGGDDITNATVGTLMTGTGASCSVTGLSYQPEFGMFLFRNIATEGSGSSTTPQQCIGFAKDSSNQWCQSWSHADASGTSAARTIYSHDRVVLQHTTSVTGYSAFSTWNADGFTLNNTDTYAVSLPIYYLVMKGGSFVVGNSTEPGSTGNQTITTNKDTKAVGVFGLDIGTANTVTASGMWSSGFGDSALNQGYVSQDELPASDPMANAARFDTDQIYANITANATATSSTLDDEATLSSVSATNFILNWTNIGNARPYRYVTFGPKIPTTPISQTKTHKYNVIGKVMVNKTDKYNIIGKVSGQFTHKFYILSKASQSKTHLWNILKLATRDKTHVYNVIKQVLSTKTHLFNILYRVLVPSKTHKYDIVGTSVPVSTTKTHKYNVITEVTVSKTHKYNVSLAKFQVSTSHTHKYNIIIRVSTSKTHKYNVLLAKFQVTKSNTHKYDIRTKLTQTKTHRYNVIGKVTQTKTHKYDILAPVTQVSQTKTHKYNVIITVSRSHTHKYNLLIKVTSLPKYHKYNVIGKVTTSKTHKFNIITKVTTSKTHLYNLSNSVSKSKTHKYNVIGKVIAPRTHPYNIVIRATINKTHKYHINYAVFPVNTSQTHKYNVIARVTKTKSHKYSILNSVTQTKTHRYTLIGKVTQFKTHKYDILVSIATVSKTHKWNAKVVVSTTRTHKYNIIQKLIASKTHRYNIPGKITRTHTHKYDISGIRTPLATTKIHVYDILNSVTNSKTHKYSIVAEVTQSKTHKFNLIEQVSKSKTHNYNIISKTSVSRTHRFNLLNRVPTASKTHKYHIRIGATKTKTHKFNIVGRITSTHKHIYGVGGRVVVSKKHIFEVSEGRVLGELGGSTNVLIKFPERVRIIDIISDIRNLAIANVEIFDSQVKPQNTAIGFVQLLEQDSRLPTSLRTASSRYQFKVASQLIVPEIEERIENKAVSGRIAIEVVPLPKTPQLQTLSNISLSKSQPLYLQSHTQIKPNDRTIINLASKTEMLPRHKFASVSKLELAYINNILLRSPEIMTKEREQTLNLLTKFLSNDDLFY